MKKKMLLIPLALFLVGALVASGCTQPAAPGGTQPATTVTVTKTVTAAAQTAEPIKLLFATWHPPTAAAPKAEVKFIKDLEQRSGGRIKVEYSQGAAMGKPAEYYNLAVTGVSDMSDHCLIYTPGAFPMAEVWEYPIAHASCVIFSRAYWELYKMGYFNNDFKDTKLIWGGAHGPYLITTISKPILTFADLAGVKIRVGGVQAEVLKAMGATPVSMPGPDIFDAMQKGVLDGNFGNWGMMLPFGIAPVIKHVTEPGATGVGHGIVMNRNYYEKLPDDIKAILGDMGEEMTIWMGLEFDRENEHVKSDVYKGAVHQFSAGDIAKMDEVCAPIWQKWIADGNAKGLPRAKMLDDLYKILQRFGVEKPLFGYKPA